MKVPFFIVTQIIVNDHFKRIPRKTGSGLEFFSWHTNGLQRDFREHLQPLARQKLRDRV